MKDTPRSSNGQDRDLNQNLSDELEPQHIDKSMTDQQPPQGPHGPILRRKVLGERGHGPVVHPKPN